MIQKKSKYLNQSNPRLLRSLRHITAANINFFERRGQTTLIRFDAGDGQRFAVVYTSQKNCVTKMVPDVATEGVGVEIYLLFLEPPTTLYVNVCAIDRHICFQCGASCQRLKYCIKCRDNKVATRYCSKECQIAHWPRHAPLCG